MRGSARWVSIAFAIAATMRSAAADVTKVASDRSRAQYAFACRRQARMLGIARAQDNVVFTTVGIDIGSSTSHLLFAKLRAWWEEKLRADWLAQNSRAKKLLRL
jgi:hypothetical protein